MAGSQDRVPGRNEPDPMNVRQNSFQGGTDGLVDSTAENIEQVSYGTVHGDNAYTNTILHGGDQSAGLSGLPEANAGNVTPQWSRTRAPGGTQ